MTFLVEFYVGYRFEIEDFHSLLRSFLGDGIVVGDVVEEGEGCLQGGGGRGRDRWRGVRDRQRLEIDL